MIRLPVFEAGPAPGWGGCGLVAVTEAEEPLPPNPIWRYLDHKVISLPIHSILHGVLIKGGRYIEKIAAADSIVFDKTGTMTEVIAFGDFDRLETLRLAA